MQRYAVCDLIRRPMQVELDSSHALRQVVHT